MKTLTYFFCAPLLLLGQATQSSGPIILDPFTAPRTNSLEGPPNDDNRLWREGATGQCVTVTGVSGGHLSISAPNSGPTCNGQWVDGTNGYGMANVLFFPQSETGWPWTSPCTKANNCQYAQGYATTIPSGTDWTAVNRLYFTMTSDTSHALYPSNTSGGVQIGYFVRSHDNSAVSNQGSHYYSFVDAGVYTGQTLYFVVNRKMQHNNTGSPTDVYPEDPEWNSCCHGQGNSSPVHFWDGETTFYIGAGPNLGGWTGNFTLGPMTMGTTSGEPDDFVSALTGTFTGSNSAGRPANTYEVAWQEPKLIPGGVNYHLYYSSNGSMHSSGISSGTASGTVRGPDGGGGAGYMNTWWNSPTTTKATNMWVAVRPDMPIWNVTNTNPITVQTRSPYDRHWLHTGDQVTIANLCSTANGTRTVTVIDNFTVSLGVSGTCSYSGYSGTNSATITSASNTTGFSEILIGPGGGGGSVSPCDLNGDGQVNNADYTLAQQQALGEAACNANVVAPGVCNVVVVQRVAIAATGGGCKTGS